MMSQLPDQSMPNLTRNGIRKRGWSEDRIEGESSHANKRVATSDEDDGGGWDEGLHRQFVDAIFEVGLRNSSPAVILENMTVKAKAITSERVKSKLQKYRNSKDKSKQEYMEEYDAFMARLKAVAYAGVGSQSDSSPYTSLEMMGCKKLLGGDAAAFLSFATLHSANGRNLESASGSGVGAAPSELLRKDVNQYVENFAGTGIPFPELTDAEKKSSLGISMTFVMGLFMSMSQHLVKQREKTDNSVAVVDDDNAGASKKASFPE